MRPLKIDDLTEINSLKNQFLDTKKSLLDKADKLLKTFIADNYNYAIASTIAVDFTNNPKAIIFDYMGHKRLLKKIVLIGNKVFIRHTYIDTNDGSSVTFKTNLEDMFAEDIVNLINALVLV